MKQNKRINKKSLIRSISKKVNCTAGEAERFVTAFIEVFGEAMENGESLCLHGIGSFTVKESAAHNGYNPITGKAEVFAARKICKFILSKKIRLPEG